MGQIKVKAKPKAYVTLWHNQTYPNPKNIILAQFKLKRGVSQMLIPKKLYYHILAKINLIQIKYQQELSL